MLNIQAIAPTLLIALAQLLMLFALGFLFGMLENTTDKEFKVYGLADSSARHMTKRTWASIIGLSLIVGVALFVGDYLYDNPLINWLMFIVVTGAEIAYFVWVLQISDRIREMVTGVCLLLATWPAFCRLSVNLRDYGQMDASWLARLIVVACTIVFVTHVIVGYAKEQVEVEPTPESEGE